ncbi:MAG: hypothetical protein WC455_21995 [Dehalococcoidia bacterium]|jgi:hypothetical protein
MSDNQRARVGDIIPIRKAGSGETIQPPRKKITSEDLLEDLHQQIEISKIAKIGESLGAFNFGGGRPGPGAGDTGMEQFAKAANLMGIDVTKIQEMRQKEVESLRSELDKERRASMEQRLGVIDNTINKMNDAMMAVAKSIQDQRTQPAASGIFGVADQVTDNSLTKAMIAKLIDLDGQKQQQRDPVDELLDRLTLGDRLKERLGLNKEEPRQMDPSLLNLGKVELIRELLLDERERETAKQNAEINKMKLDKLSGVFKMIEDYIPDVLEAMKSRGGHEPAAARIPAAATAARAGREPEKPAAAETPSPEEMIFEEITCPHPGCGGRQPFPTNIPDGYGINCGYCGKLILKAPLQPQDQQKTAEPRVQLAKPNAPAKPDMSRDKEREVEDGYGEQLPDKTGSVEDNEADS